MKSIISLPVKIGEFPVLEVNGTRILAGVTGDILEVTPPPGQRVKLTNLSTSAGFEQSGISILFGATSVLSEKIYIHDCREDRILIYN